MRSRPKRRRLSSSRKRRSRSRRRSKKCRGSAQLPCHGKPTMRPKRTSRCPVKFDPDDPIMQKRIRRNFNQICKTTSDRKMRNIFNTLPVAERRRLYTQDFMSNLEATRNLERQQQQHAETIFLNKYPNTRQNCEDYEEVVRTLEDENPYDITPGELLPEMFKNKKRRKLRSTVSRTSEASTPCTDPPGLTRTVSFPRRDAGEFFAPWRRNRMTVSLFLLSPLREP